MKPFFRIDFNAEIIIMIKGPTNILKNYKLTVKAVLQKLMKQFIYFFIS